MFHDDGHSAKEKVNSAEAAETTRLAVAKNNGVQQIKDAKLELSGSSYYRASRHNRETERDTQKDRQTERKKPRTEDGNTGRKHRQQTKNKQETPNHKTTEQTQVPIAKQTMPRIGKAFECVGAPSGRRACLTHIRKG